MPMTPKLAGQGCPTCGHMPAEHKRADEDFMRWTCNNCGASGRVGFEQPTGRVGPKPPTVHPHWSKRRS
jgi:ribosomal protein L37AE/L43A